MSTYAVVLATLPQRRRVRQWLDRHQVRAEDRFEAAAGPHTLFLIARDVHSHIRGNRLLIGTVIDVPRRTVAFGPAAMTSQGTDGALGEFLDVAWDRTSVTVTRDLFGTVPMVHTEGPGVVAVSDSVLLLHDLRRELGWTSSTNVEAATARTRTLAMFQQQLSPDTLLTEVSFVPAGHGVRLPLWTLHPSAETDGASLPARVAAVSDDRVSLTRRAAGDVAGLVRAVAQVPAIVPSLMLSGGVDSRALLAAAKSTGVLEAYDIKSWNRTAANAPDYDCAVGLSERCGFTLNPPRRGDPEEDALKLADSGVGVFATSHLGLYDRVLPVSGTLHQPRAVLLGGQGAGVLKGAYGYRSGAQIDQWLREGRDPSPHAEARRRACVAQVLKGVRSLDVDPEAPDASEWHYAAYRAGLHGGAHIPLSLTGMRPLQLLELLAMGHWPDAGGVGEQRTFSLSQRGMLDLMMLMDPELAVHPFVGSQTPAPEDVATRLRALGGALTAEEIPSFEVRGEQCAVGGGPHSLGESIARDWGLDDITPDDVVARTQPWVDAIADEALRDSQDRLGRLTTNELAKGAGRRLSDAGPGPAKRLSAVLLARG